MDNLKLKEAKASIGGAIVELATSPFVWGFVAGMFTAFLIATGLAYRTTKAGVEIAKKKLEVPVRRLEEVAYK